GTAGTYWRCMSGAATGGRIRRARHGGLMKEGSLRILTWTARVLGVAVAVFIGIFALDAFEPGKPIGRALVDFVIHLTPSLALLLIVALSWRRAWIGGAAFMALAIVYAVSVSGRPDWVLAISGPLAAAGVLFLWSWASARTVRG